MQTIIAQLRYAHLAPRKVRQLANTIKNKPAEEAVVRLMVATQRPRIQLLKVLKSAIQNAKHNFKIDISKLYVKEIRIDQGPKSKRYMPRARGSAGLIQKKTAHITIVLGVKETAGETRFTFEEKKKKEEKKKGTKKGKETKEEKSVVEEKKVEKAPKEKKEPKAKKETTKTSEPKAKKAPKKETKEVNGEK